jgi:hypothetical protein
VGVSVGIFRWICGCPWARCSRYLALNAKLLFGCFCSSILGWKWKEWIKGNSPMRWIWGLNWEMDGKSFYRPRFFVLCGRDFWMLRLNRGLSEEPGVPSEPLQRVSYSGSTTPRMVFRIKQTNESKNFCMMSAFST